MFEPLHWYVRYVEGVNVTSFHQLTPFGMSILVSASEEWAGRELDLTVEQWRLSHLTLHPGSQEDSCLILTKKNLFIFRRKRFNNWSWGLPRK